MWGSFFFSGYRRGNLFISLIFSIIFFIFSITQLLNFIIGLIIPSVVIRHDRIEINNIYLPLFFRKQIVGWDQIKEVNSSHENITFLRLLLKNNEIIDIDLREIRRKKIDEIKEIIEININH